MMELIVLFVILAVGGFVLYLLGLVLNRVVDALEGAKKAPELESIALELQEIVAGKEEQIKELEERSGLKRDTSYQWWWVESNKYNQVKRPMHPTAISRNKGKEIGKYW